MKHMKKRKVFLLIAVCLLLAGMGTRLAMAALENSKSSGVRSVHVSDSQIPVSTLVVGSYLIHINGLSDEIYQKAQESANEFNQSQIYYKSELAGGQWFSITDAASIMDITTSGTPVSKSVIEALEFTHRTDANGVTTDLRTGKTVSSFDIPDPYDLEAMQELEPLKIQYQLIQEKEKKSDSDEKYISMLGGFFGASIRDSETNDCDSSINALEQYKSGLTGRDKPAAWTAAVEDVQTHVDATRRVRSLTILSENLDKLLDQASGRAVSNGFGSNSLLGNLGGMFSFSARKKSSKDDNSEEEQVDPDFIVNSDVVAAIGDAGNNVAESLSSYSAKILEEGTSAATKSRYQYTNDLILQTKAGNQAASDTATENLCSLDNILNGTIGDQAQELDALNQELISQALDTYKGKLSVGIVPAYGEALAAGSSEGALNKILKDQQSDTDAARLEYQSMLEAAFLRMDNSAAQEYTGKLIEAVPDLRSLVPQDAVSSYQLETVETHLRWLRKELTALIQEGTDTSEMADLQSELDELEKQRLDALDANDLAKAKRLEAEAAAKKKDLDDMTRNLTDVLNSSASSEADRARALAQLSSDGTASMINNLADRIISDIQDGLGVQAIIVGSDTSGTGFGDESGIETGTGIGPGTGSETGTESGSGNESGTGAGSGTGMGSGSGSTGETGPGTGSGNGPGMGSGSASGAGTGTGSGAANGSGIGTGTANGNESATGAGSGNNAAGGSGTGAGSGSGMGSGSGTGSGSAAGTGTGTGTGSETENGNQENRKKEIVGSGENWTDFNNAMSALEAAGSLDPEAAKGALDQIKEAVDQMAGLDPDVADFVTASLDQIDETLDDAALTDTSSLSEKQLTDQIGEVLGGSFASASPQDQSAMIVALDQLGNEAPNQNARNLAAKLANQAANSGNIYLYKKYTADEKTRISLQAVERILKYRYIFDQSHNTATLQKGKRYYTFTVRKDSCQMSGGESKKLSGPAVYNGVMYLLAEDGKQLFDMSAYYIGGSGYGTVVTGSMESQIQNFYDQMTGGGA